MTLRNAPPEALELLGKLASDPVHYQQYLDFLRNTRFRQSLLCHQGMPIDQERHPERLLGLLVASPAKPVSPSPDLREGVRESFESGKSKFTTSISLVKAAMMELASVWPRALPFEVLAANAAGRAKGANSGYPVELDRNLLANSLLNGFVSSVLIELSTWQPEFASSPSERPLASPLARWQARHQGTVTNLLHRSVGLHKLHQHLLPYLDGTRVRAALIDTMVAELRGGALRVHRDGQLVQDEKVMREGIESTLEDGLKQMAGFALFIR
jgi:methyltransferase-like protein